MATCNGLKFLRHFLLTTTYASLCVLAANAQDPPSRVADLNYVTGNVSLQPAGADDWSPAVMNRPLTTGDYLWADNDSRAELHLNNAVIRLGPQSSLGFLNLDDSLAQLRFAQGEMILRVRRIREDESFEVDTPNAAVTILREGEYRFNADPDSATTWVVVRHGEAEVTGGGQAFSLRAGNSAQLSGTDQLAYDVQYAPDPDGFEAWSEDQDSRYDRSPSARYLPPDVIGYEELDNNGVWRETPGYGAVWYPSVDANWAPYRDGYWSWIEPWGWTWVDNSPWGFAPSHYGRWAYVGGGWGWIPGPMVVAGGGPAMRAVYAPALVAFIGGGGWGASLSIGGPAVGWVPLGPGEVYTPAYQVSQNYFRTVNVSNTTVVNTVNITNVYNNVYVNKNVTNVTVNQRFANMTAPNAVTAMPQNAFASGRPVKQVGVTVPRNQVAQAQAASMTIAPSVAPVKQSLAPGVVSRPVMRPPARAISMPVVAKVAPPPPPVPFAAKQAALQQNVGRPVNIPAIRQTIAPRAVPVAAPVVRVAPPARQVVPQVRPVQAAPPARTPPPPATPANRPPTPAQPAPQNNPRPNETYRPPQAPPQQPANPRPPENNPRTVEPPPARPPQPSQVQPPPRPVQPPPPAPRATQPPPQEKPAAKPPAKPKKETEKDHQ
ncbi:MAG TPA: FecR family protein [Bryobacteraceae bacterium]|nr:FecR family protein [Bryobacteraceae bacterium]